MLSTAPAVRLRLLRLIGKRWISIPSPRSCATVSGISYWKLYRYDDAERELNELLRRDPKDPRAAFTLGDLYLTRGDAPKALPFLETAVVAYPNEFDTRFALGRAFMLMGQLERGIEELRAAVKIRDSVADGHFQLGRALIRAGAKEEGRLELQRAQALHLINSARMKLTGFERSCPEIPTCVLARPRSAANAAPGPGPGKLAGHRLLSEIHFQRHPEQLDPRASLPRSSHSRPCPTEMRDL